MQKFLIIISIFLCAACTMPETRIYSLSLPVERKLSGNTSGASANVLVRSPRYLSQHYVACRTSPYQLDISKYSKWDSPPDELVRDAFREVFYSKGVFREVKTANFIPAGYYSVDIKLRRFERTDSGEGSFGEIDFDVLLVSPDGKELYRHTVSKKIRLESRNNLELAKALSSALSEGVVEAVSGIAGVMNRP